MLKWNSDYDAIVSYFKTVSIKGQRYMYYSNKIQRFKLNIIILQAKKYLNRWFIYFHEFLIAFGIRKPKNSTEKHTIAIVIKKGPGLPLIYKGSYKSDELGISNLDLLFTSFLDADSLVTFNISSLDIGSIIVFNAGIEQKDPAVKGVNRLGIFLLY
jgi:hypothetical protein